MISFTDWNKKKEEKIDYEIVKSRSGLPMFILPSPDLPPDDDDREVEVITDLELGIKINPSHKWCRTTSPDISEI